MTHARLALLVPLLSAAALAAAEPPLAVRSGALLDDVRTLSSPALDGRLPGTPGYDRAAAFVEDRFRSLGLAAGFPSGYRREVPLERNEIDVCRLSIASAGRPSRPLTPGADFVCRGFTGSSALEVPVVFAGFGLSLPELGWDDYAGLDVRGKAVLAFKEPPPFAPPRGGRWGESHLPRPKALTAAEHGAVALLLVTVPRPGAATAPIGSVLHGPGAQDPAFPQLHVSPAVAAELLGGGPSLAERLAALETSCAPRSGALGSRVAVEVAARYTRHASAPNLLAVLPGVDPLLKDEVVVLGAHLDHVGRQGALLFPGANDDASGAAGVLEIASAFVRAGLRPGRTVAFVLFTAEEPGLLGSSAFVESSPWPLSKLVAMLNLDCIGLGEALQLGGGSSAPRLWALARSLDAGLERVTVEATWKGGGADAEAFFSAGVPTLYFVTTKGYAHLHLPTDTVETLRLPLFTSAVRLAAETVRAVAGGEYVREAVAR